MSHDFIYFAEKDRFIDLFTGDLHTHRELDFFMDMEKEHKDSLPSYSFQELMEIFPTAVPAAKRGVNANIKRVKEQISALDGYRERRTKGLEKINIFDRPGYVEDIETDIADMLAEYEKELKTYYYHLSHLKKLEMKKKGVEVKDSGTGITDEDVEMARRVKISNFIKVRHDRKAVCLFHSEKTPSMHVYPDHFYCFSCNQKGDVIDIVQKQQGLDFRNAVLFLIGKKI